MYAQHCLLAKSSTQSSSIAISSSETTIEPGCVLVKEDPVVQEDALEVLTAPAEVTALDEVKEDPSIPVGEDSMDLDDLLQWVDDLDISNI